MKLLGHLLKWLLLSLLGIVLLVLLFLVLDRDAQHITLSKTDRDSIKVLKKYVLPADSSVYYSLLKTWGENKKLAPNFEFQCLLALSHYPELKKVPIDFLVQPAFIQLSARPDPITVLLPWVKRKYLVVISNDTGRENDPILLSKAPFNEQVGIIGHELAHVVFYLDKNSLYLAKLAYQYQYNEAFATVLNRKQTKGQLHMGSGISFMTLPFLCEKPLVTPSKKLKRKKEICI